MKIGISVLTHEGQSIWENGLGQNIFYFVQLLRGLPFVKEIVLLNCGDQPRLPPEAEALAQGVPLVAPRDLAELPDVIVEMGGGLDVEWLDYARAQGKKVVFFCCGQPYVGLIEPSVFQRDGYFSRATRCDEIWVLGKDRALMPMLRTLHRCPVFEVPFLWDSTFIEQRIAAVEQVGLKFGYQSRSALGESVRRSLRVAVFEPNISVVKCCVIPMLIGEAAFRAEPDAVKSLHLLNSVQMRDHPSFSFLLGSMDLHRQERVRLDGRHDFAGFMSQHADAVIAHHWQNDQNILYLDALYGGYPLIHNSPWLEGYGYYYPDSDIETGAAQLLRARQHDTHHKYYLQRTRSFLASLSPREPANISAYARRLLALTGKKSGMAA
ncbi:DUF2827 domain-containing protein [Paraburkholderia sprentiae WSM5005]|uniref:DUF2827 domain-containing protein n=1 Tax=Paraburkholderia sprentiae WSM5005 TaxID=754502 RepID=A0A1I9YJN5_9BURK|nr:DUF2827 family protein [Paraburkholderia sprentiae]APA86518.1 DUF2827 domain-containing protein [Paraburkholderia sprentiae WSM5005]